MKIAALYDIHGNIPALDAVLAEVQSLEVDLIIIGGDVVAGPMPNESLDRLRNLDIPIKVLHGNGESEVNRIVAGQPPQAITPTGEAGAYRVAEVLTDPHKAWIASWPTTVEVEHPALGRLLFCHATPQEDVTIFTRNSDPEKIKGIFAGVQADVVVCGHVHLQHTFELDHLNVVRAGSVGMPYGRTGAEWLLIADTLEFRHTSYDADAAAERLRQSDDPTVDGFIQNYIYSAPEIEAALKIVGQLEAGQDG